MNGVRAIVESGGVSHHAWEEHTQLYFANGWVRVASPSLLLKNTAAGVEIYRAGDTQEFRHPVPTPYSWSFRREAEHFVKSLRTGQPFRSSAEDTLTDLRLFEDIYRAFASRTP